jgi:hypothetical protein
VLTSQGGGDGPWTGRRDASSRAAAEAASRLGCHCQEKNSSSLPAQPASLSAAPCFIFFLFSRPDISAHSSNPPRDAASGHISAAPTCNHPKPFAHPHPHTYISLPQRFQQRVRCRICFQQLYFLFFSSKVVVPVEYTYIIGCIS